MKKFIFYCLFLVTYSTSANFADSSIANKVYLKNIQYGEIGSPSLFVNEVDMAIGSRWYDVIYKNKVIADAGLVRLYKKVNDTWIENGILQSPTPSEIGNFGIEVSINKNFLLINERQSDRGDDGYYSVLHIYQKQKGIWMPYQKIEDRNLFKKHSWISDSSFVTAINISELLIFKLNSSGVWEVKQKIKEAYNNTYGENVIVNNDKIIVSCPEFNVGWGDKEGKIYVYTKNSTGDYKKTYEISNPDKNNLFFGRIMVTNGDYLILSCPITKNNKEDISNKGWVASFILKKDTAYIESNITTESGSTIGEYLLSFGNKVYVSKNRYDGQKVFVEYKYEGEVIKPTNRKFELRFDDAYSFQIVNYKLYYFDSYYQTFESGQTGRGGCIVEVIPSVK